MAEDPVEWLESMIATGVHIRENGIQLKTREAGASWEQRALEWATELQSGVTARSRRDAPRVQVINEFPPLDLPKWHIWYDARALKIDLTATGEGRPGNNPLSRHVALIKRAEQIVTEWRQALPSTPKLAKVSVNYDDFAKWYLERADAHAKTGTRSSREQDRDAAAGHFGCKIPWEWITDARRTLPDDHPYLERGRPRYK